ncbi:DUF3696 domain-containing protein [Burkholderia ambifaria]|uniref:DUF3696 domain-containing protein n=1 Tax=Burkholderia ambifaria TaxID=152480 RepID=UPI00158C7705|nr:DUF3696 domain-containing protein [Burkholderia ambifaria]
MLRRFYVENFKAWSQLDLTLGQVTGLFGTNSSGKSSIIQFLLLLKQTKNATDRNLVLDFGGPDQLINLGSFRDIVHLHNEKSDMHWQLRWDLSHPLELNDPFSKRSDTFASGTSLTHSSEVSFRNGLLTCGSIEYRVGDYGFAIHPKKKDSKEFELSATTISKSEPGFRFVRNKARAWALPGPLKTYLYPDQAQTYYQNSSFLGLFEFEYEQLMDSIYYLGPLREYPRREYPWSGASPSDVGKRGERTMEAILSATHRKETRNLGGRTHYRPFQEIIAHWLKTLGLISDFQIEEIGKGANLYRAIVKRDAKSAPALLTDVGFGVSQVLPALVLLYYVPEGSTVIMEQPEIHLHPSVQSGLADVILKVAQTRKLQVIVESHSEHLLRRFQLRVAEEKYPSDMLKLYFCDYANGAASLNDLDIDIFGEIKNWPKNFFGDEMSEIAKTRQAILRRKIKERQGGGE